MMMVNYQEHVVTMRCSSIYKPETYDAHDYKGSGWHVVLTPAEYPQNADCTSIKDAERRLHLIINDAFRDNRTHDNSFD